MYDIYAAHMDALRTFSAGLWAETDLMRLEAAAADTAKKLHALHSLRGLPVLDAVEAATAAFAAVLPLLRSVRHDALRPRHWEQLMKATGSAQLMLYRCIAGHASLACMHAYLACTPAVTWHSHERRRASGHGPSAPDAGGSAGHAPGAARRHRGAAVRRSVQGADNRGGAAQDCRELARPAFHTTPLHAWWRR